mgnify:CR=1 FL=1
MLYFTDFLLFLLINFAKKNSITDEKREPSILNLCYTNSTEVQRQSD